MTQERQGLQFTKQQSTSIFKVDQKEIIDNMTNLKKYASIGKTLENPILKDIQNDAFPLSYASNIKNNNVEYSIVDATPKNIAYIDLTERFLYRSSRGNEYIIIGYYYDGNAILVEPLNNKTITMITESMGTNKHDF